jgi:hypothetical protein
VNLPKWTLIGIAATLVGCGGGDSGSEPPSTGSITLSGTAAKGAALAGATVTAKCAAGTGIGTTSSDGRYNMTIAGAALPCALKAAGTDGTVFHSLVGGSGSSGTYTANITPLTEMVVAQVAGASPASYFGGFGNGSTLPGLQVAGAIAYVQAALAPLASLNGVNPLTDALTVGNALDQKIDAVMAGLVSAGLTLEQVSTAIAANPKAPGVVAAPLAPAATTCAWLKSGRYRMVTPYEPDPQLRAPVFEVNAAALTVSLNGVTAPLADNGGCQFSLTEADGFVNKVIVSSAGVMLAYNQYPDGSQRSAGVGLPEQTLPVSEFAGTWNVAGWDPASGVATPGFVAQTAEVTIDATGQVTAVSDCLGLAACTGVDGPFPSLAGNAAGGFDMADGGVPFARVFLFKTWTGQAMFVFISEDGQLLVGTRKQAIATLPAVGAVTNYREFALNGNGTISNLLDETVTVTAVNATTRTVTRLRTRDSRVDTIAFDKPRDGLRYRAQGSCTHGVTGAALNCAETVQLPLQGMGITLAMSVGIDPTTAFMSVAINKPD